MKIQKIIKTGMFFALILVLLSPVFAANALIIKFNPSQTSIENVFAIEDNVYYQELFESSLDKEFLQENDVFVRLLSDNALLLEQEIDSDDFAFVVLDLDVLESANKIAIMKNDQIIIENRIDFCNNNGVCEPCNMQDCELSENVAVCADCRFNTADNFCDLQRDGVCDPDCVAKYSCDDCQQDCVYEDQGFTCESQNGVICQERENCTGEIIFTDNSARCCIGECIPEIQLQIEQEKSAIPPEEIEEILPEKANTLLFYFILIFVAITIVIFIFYFRKRAQEKDSGKIQDEINDLLQQRLAYPQIKIVLKRRGYSDYFIDTELKKNYEAYKAGRH